MLCYILCRTHPYKDLLITSYICNICNLLDQHATLREGSSQNNVILQYKLLASILSAVCSVIQQSQYVLHFYYTLHDGKYDCKITLHQTIFQLQCFVLLNNHQYNCNITKSFLSALSISISYVRHTNVFALVGLLDTLLVTTVTNLYDLTI